MRSVRAAKTKYLLEGNKILAGPFQSWPVNKNADNLLDLMPSSVVISTICMLAPGMNTYNAHCSNPSRKPFKSFTILLFTDEQQQHVQDKSYLRLLPTPEGKWSWNCFLLMYNKCLLWLPDTHFTLEILLVYRECLLLHPFASNRRRLWGKEGARMMQNISNTEKKQNSSLSYYIYKATIQRP